MTTDQGDIATLTLTVSPFDLTTTATVAVTSPTNIASAPTATPNVDRSVWTAQLPLVEAGEYVARWTVTGVGAGVEQQSVVSLPSLPVSIAGQRIYATTADLAHHLEGAALPAYPRKLLRQASADVEGATKCAVYATDEDGFPTDAAVILAFKDAVCAQVEWWGATGDALGVQGSYQSVKIGSVALSGGPGTTGTRGELAANARTILDNAGLLPGVVSAYQPWEGAWQ